MKIRIPTGLTGNISYSMDEKSYLVEYVNGIADVTDELGYYLMGEYSYLEEVRDSVTEKTSFQEEKKEISTSVTSKTSSPPKSTSTKRTETKK